MMFYSFAKIRPLFLRRQLRTFSLVPVFDNSRPKRNDLYYDVTIIGGGIIGVAIGREITKKSENVKSVLIEKENGIGKHQSSHNSGVIHSGIYYKPGSLKATLCSRGIDLTLKYCNENAIPYAMSGKLIVAKDFTETDMLRKLHERGEGNNVKGLKMLWTREEIKKIEPKCHGVQALWCPKTGNVDWSLVTDRLERDFRRNGGDILLNNEVVGIQESQEDNYPIIIETRTGISIKTKYLIICGGLHSEVLSNLIDEKSKPDSVVISLRVDYQLLETQQISTNIYGIPDMELPFLGPHISPKMDGSVLLGPAAVPAYEIEGYRDDEFNFNYLKNTVSSINFQNMTRKYFSKCLNQVVRNFWPCYQVEQLQKLAKIRAEEVKPGPTAVQATLINKDGSFSNDFLIEFFEGTGMKKRIINCKFLPSPAATCSLAIAELVSEKLFQKYVS